MPGKNVRSAVTCVGLAFILSEVLLVTTPGTAGILDATWTAPTTNTDGSLLTDLASYRLYYATGSSPCPGSSSVQVASPTSSPGPSLTMSYRLTGLTSGMLYNVAVSAVDATGNQSSCSSIASAIARAEFAASPTGTVNFGSVNLGSFAEQTFTVSSTGGGTVSGSASVAAPFSIASGIPFTLSGAGATQAVKVRFTPTTTTTVSTNLTFTAGGGTISAIVTGTGAGAGANPQPPQPPAPPGTPNLTLQTAGADLVQYSVAWAASAGATSYAWRTGFNDGSGGQTGATNVTSIMLSMPYHSSGLAATAFFCANAVAAGLASTNSCNGYTVPAKPVAPPPPPPGDTTPPTISIGSSIVTGGSVSLAGQAVDNVAVAQVTWRNSRGGSGTATGTTSWSATIPVRGGWNTITVTAIDTAGRTASRSITIKGR